MTCFIKIRSEKIKMTWKIYLLRLFYFCMIFFFFLNMMTLQFCEYYLSNSVVLSLLPLLCNHGNLTRKNSYLNEG